MRSSLGGRERRFGLLAPCVHGAALTENCGFLCRLLRRHLGFGLAAIQESWLRLRQHLGFGLAAIEESWLRLRQHVGFGRTAIDVSWLRTIAATSHGFGRVRRARLTVCDTPVM